MDMREKFTIDDSHFSNMAGFYDKVERMFTFGLDLIFTQEHYPGTILTTEKLLFSSGRRTMRNPITPTSRIGMPSALCCWWPPAIHTMSRCHLLWRRTGTSGSIRNELIRGK